MPAQQTWPPQGTATGGGGNFTATSAIFHATADVCKAGTDGQTVFTTKAAGGALSFAPTVRLAVAIEIGQRMWFTNFTHTAPGGVNTITLTNGLTAAADADVIVYYHA